MADGHCCAVSQATTLWLEAWPARVAAACPNQYTASGRTRRKSARPAGQIWSFLGESPALPRIKDVSQTKTRDKTLAWALADLQHCDAAAASGAMHLERYRIAI